VLIFISTFRFRVCDLKEIVAVGVLPRCWLLVLVLQKNTTGIETEVVIHFSGKPMVTVVMYIFLNNLIFKLYYSIPIHA